VRRLQLTEACESFKAKWINCVVPTAKKYMALIGCEGKDVLVLFFLI
jgi:hypothetical protein